MQCFVLSVRVVPSVHVVFILSVGFPIVLSLTLRTSLGDACISISLKVRQKIGTSICYRAMSHFLEYFGGSRYINIVIFFQETKHLKNTF